MAKDVDDLAKEIEELREQLEQMRKEREFIKKALGDLKQEDKKIWDRITPLIKRFEQWRR